LFTLNSIAWEDSSYWLKDSSNVIITNSNIDTFKNSILFNYEITFWDTGRVVIPPHYINISFPDSLVPSIFKTDSSEVLITSVFDSTMTTVINDKPLKEIKFPIERLKLFAFFLLITSILYFIYLLSTRNSQKLKIRKFFNLNPSELKEYFQDNELNILLDEIDQAKFAKKESSKSEKKGILELLKKVIRRLL